MIRYVRKRPTKRNSGAAIVALSHSDRLYINSDHYYTSAFTSRFAVLANQLVSDQPGYGFGVYPSAFVVSRDNQSAYGAATILMRQDS